MSTIILFGTLVAVTSIALIYEGERKRKYIAITVAVYAILLVLIKTYSLGYDSASMQFSGSKKNEQEMRENFEYQKSQIIYQLAADLPPSPQEYKVIGMGNEGTPTKDLVMVQKLSLSETQPRLYRIPSSLKDKSGSITVGSRLSYSEDGRWSIINNDVNVER